MNNKKLSTTTFGLIGHPLGHSFSKAFFTDFFAANGVDLSYDNFDLAELSPSTLYSLLLLNPQLLGFNVTIPYKKEIMQYLDSVSPVAERAGAVNTVKIQRSSDGRVLGLHGYNTDVTGFRKSIEPLLAGVDPEAGALILGTGGASAAVAEVFRDMGRPFFFVSRTRRDESTIGYEDISSELLTRFTIVVNTTPVGTFPDTAACPPFPCDLLGSGNVVFDLIYNPARTELLRRGAERGAAICNGLGMLKSQALASLSIWTDGALPSE